MKVNGSVTTNVALLVNPDKDKIEVNGKSVLQSEQLVYYMLNKPRGYVSTVSDPEGRKTVTSLFPSRLRLYPVGRLDIDSEGLILLTNDGNLAYTLTHPKYEVEKTYRVLIQGSPTNSQLNKLATGVKLKDGWTKPAQIEIFRHEEGDTWVDITIHEGRNRQVRRMCAYVGLEIKRLIRVRIGNLLLGDLTSGGCKKLTKEDILLLQNRQRIDHGKNSKTE